MIKLENTEVYGWAAAIRGMRNPMNSWEQSDSEFSCLHCDGCYYQDKAIVEVEETEESIDTTSWCNHTCLKIGENDLKLMKSLSKAGNDHGKFLRMITVTVDITAPLYWWKEFDTYKVGTVANSCSTMHKIQAKEFELDDFSHEHLITEEENCGDWTLGHYAGEVYLSTIISGLNYYRDKYLETKDKDDWWQMIQLLPSSYNQKRTVQINYQVGKAQRAARRHHKLDEWHAYCDWLESLPYFKEVCIDEIR